MNCAVCVGIYFAAFIGLWGPLCLPGVFVWQNGGGGTRV